MIASGRVEKIDFNGLRPLHSVRKQSPNGTPRDALDDISVNDYSECPVRPSLSLSRSCWRRGGELTLIGTALGSPLRFGIFYPHNVEK